MATRRASISCDSEEIRTFVSSKRSRRMRTPLVTVLMDNCWSANARRVASVWLSIFSEICRRASLSDAIASCRRAVCSCSIRTSAMTCWCSRSAPSAPAGAASRAAAQSSAVR